MAGTTHLELEFADGTYTFALKLPQILELQRVCDGDGIFTIYARVMRGRLALSGQTMGVPHEGAATLRDCLDTVRLALIGGGRGQVNGEDVEISALRAKDLVETYLHPPAPLKQAWDLAAAILHALIEGYEPTQKKSQDEVEAEEATG